MKNREFLYDRVRSKCIYVRYWIGIKILKLKSSFIKSSDNVRSIAYHEAGHAVIAYMNELDIDYVTIKKDEMKDEQKNGNAAGVVYYKTDYLNLFETFDLLRKRLWVTMAGPIASENLGIVKMDNWSYELRETFLHTVDYIRGFAQQKWRNILKDYRSKIINDSTFEVAEALLGYIKDEEIANRIVAIEYEEAQRLIYLYWEEIEAVAEALLEQKTLTGEDIHKIIERKNSVTDTIQRI